MGGKRSQTPPEVLWMSGSSWNNARGTCARPARPLQLTGGTKSRPFLYWWAQEKGQLSHVLPCPFSSHCPGTFRCAAPGMCSWTSFPSPALGSPTPQL